jgi:hypothetical protein
MPHCGLAGIQIEPCGARIGAARIYPNNPSRHIWRTNLSGINPFHP